MHSIPVHPHAIRVLIVAIAVGVAIGGALWSLLTALRDTLALIGSPVRASVDELVVALSAGAALVLLLWVALGLLASVVAALPGPLGAVSRRMRDTIAPEAVKRWAGLLLGVAVVSTCGPGGAAAGEIRSMGSLDASSTSSAPAPLWVEPSASASASASAPAPAPAPAAPAPAPEWTPPRVRSLPPVTLTAPRPPAENRHAEVTVRRGDTLWDLAAAYLPPEATDAEIATGWQRWWTANHDIIGPDPDLILPGQVLTVPAALDATAGAAQSRGAG